MSLTRRPLSPETWPGFAALVAADGGVRGGCRCIGFHTRDRAGPEANRPLKERMVRDGTTNSALVHDGDACVGWAQNELAAIKNRKPCGAGSPEPADWRITGLYTGRGRRGAGIARRGVEGAPDLIGQAGGGRVEACPEETEGRKVSGSFLWNGNLRMFEALGFARERKFGKRRRLVRREVAAS